ncbi:MAG: hypothetical protein ACI9BW_001649 [Gammaproteobacteria bacterium]|jgi:hypothetical protein
MKFSQYFEGNGTLITSPWVTMLSFETMSIRIVSRMLVISAWAFSCSAAAATVDVFGVMFDPVNGTTRARIVTGGYGPALFSGGSDNWVPTATMGQSLGTFFRVPTFQPEYDGTDRFGDVGSSVTLGSDPGAIAGLTNTLDVISTRWADGIGLRNDSGNDLAIFEKATSEAYAIRVREHATKVWTRWYYQIFNQTDAVQFTTPTVYDLTDLGIASGAVIDEVEIRNLRPEDTVASSIYDLDEFGAFSGLNALGFGFVTLGGAISEFAPARRRSDPLNAPVGFEAGKFDPDIQYVVGLNPLVIATPLPPALFLILAALGVLTVNRRRIAT